MRTLWGSLSICPLLDHVDLQYHMVGELLSISCLKVWGDTQKPHSGMAYLLVKVEDSSEGRGYSLALVWISPCQARASTMEEALGILSICTSNGLNWPYVFIQLYEGANHVPLPKDKHLGILSQGNAESPCGQISQLEVCQLLSARLRVIYPVGLNGDDQSATIDLPGLLHSSSSVTIDDHLYIKIDIPSPTPVEQDNANPPLGRVHTTLAVTTPMTPWKPRISLRAEVGNLLDWGMTEDYDQELKHSTMVREPSTKADTSLPQQVEVPVQSLDTSSQVSTAETEGSLDSNPICNSPTAVAYSSHSDSPTMDLSELQANANMAVNQMLSIKRSLDLNRQQAIQDFEVLLKQREAEEAATNKRARTIHLRSDLDAKVKCTKAVMKAKYEYRVAVQEARATTCNELEELEATYLEAIGENAAAKLLQCAADHSEHARLMHELERQALDAENKNHQDFLLTHQSVLCHAPQSLKENLHSSYHILLGQSSSSFWCIPSARAPQTDGQPPATTSPKPEPIRSPLPKSRHSSTDAQGDTSVDKDFSMASQEGPSSSKIGKTVDCSPP